jgi:hypothetical protein
MKINKNMLLFFIIYTFYSCKKTPSIDNFLDKNISIGSNSVEVLNKYSTIKEKKEGTTINDDYSYFTSIDSFSCNNKTFSCRILFTFDRNKLKRAELYIIDTLNIYKCLKSKYEYDYKYKRTLDSTDLFKCIKNQNSTITIGHNKDITYLILQDKYFFPEG